MKLTKHTNNDEIIPLEFHLSQNYPNPFREKTMVKYCIAYRTNVQLTVFNTYGEVIEKLVDEEMDAGTYEVVFNAVRQGLPEGNYYCKLEAGEYSLVKKIILMK
jgi:hypothetical protein